MKKYSIITGFILLVCSSLKGQDLLRHEVSFSGNFGLSSLQYTPTPGKQKNEIGGNIGLGYLYSFTDHIGLKLGAEIALYNAKYTADQIDNEVRGLIDEEQDLFDLYSTIRNYTEKQRLAALLFPVMIQYQPRIFGEQRFYGLLGGKIGLPLQNKFQSSGAAFDNEGYFIDYENWATTQEFMGFGNFSDRNRSEKLKGSVFIMLSAEAGIKWRLSESFSLYTGVYVDYALQNIRKESTRNFIEYDPLNGNRFSNNSVVMSHYSQGGTATDFVKNIKPFAVGIKLNLAFGIR